MMSYLSSLGPLSFKEVKQGGDVVQNYQSYFEKVKKNRSPGLNYEALVLAIVF